MIVIVGSKRSYFYKKYKKTNPKGIWFINFRRFFVLPTFICKFLLKIFRVKVIYFRQIYPFDKQCARLVLQLKKDIKIVDRAFRERPNGTKKDDLEILQKSGLLKYNFTTADKQNITELVFPCVVKWVYGFGGEHVYVVKNISDYQEVVKRYHDMTELLVMPFIAVDMELKIVALDGVIVGQVLAMPFNGTKCKYDLRNPKIIEPDEVLGLAEFVMQVYKQTAKSICKMDILYDYKNFYILEVNRTPGLEYIEDTAKHDYFGDIIAYLHKL